MAKPYLPVGCFGTAFTYGALRLHCSTEAGSCLEGRVPAARAWEEREFGSRAG